MPPTRASFLRKLAAAAGCFLAIGCCVKWVDRPAALWAFEHGRHRGIFIAMNYLLFPIMAFVCLRLAGYGIGAIFFGRKSYRLDTAFGCCLSVAIALTLSETLKVVTGRTGPETFQGTPSWISDGIYGFFPFHKGLGYAYFPSGHAAITSAFAGVLWTRVPALRGVWLALIVAMTVGLYAADWHWISDIIAGLALGLFCARTTEALLDRDATPKQAEAHEVSSRAIG
jgi:membrane-associated phospholipid phosphatase